MHLFRVFHQHDNIPHVYRGNVTAKGRRSEFGKPSPCLPLAVMLHFHSELVAAAEKELPLVRRPRQTSFAPMVDVRWSVKRFPRRVPLCTRVLHPLVLFELPTKFVEELCFKLRVMTKLPVLQLAFARHLPFIERPF